MPKLQGFEKRKQLFEKQSGKCYYCEGDMVLLKLSGHAKTHPLNLCTIEHLDDKFSAERGKWSPGSIRRVGACWKCNHDRAKLREKAVGIEILRQRSKRKAFEKEEDSINNRGL